MTFMNAKEARPVDDPKALVPFGWAPGGYHCAACSTCGEAHAGSDKRSMRCQDCAEALRDKRADEPTPTTRETADHAELARLASEVENNATPLAVSLYRHATAPHHVLSLLSDIAALRGKELLWTEVAQKAQEDRILADQRATQAERQRDELRKALEPFAEAAESLDDETSDHDHIWEQPAAMSIDAGHLRTARALLANQGADQ